MAVTGFPSGLRRIRRLFRFRRTSRRRSTKAKRRAALIGMVLVLAAGGVAELSRALREGIRPPPRPVYKVGAPYRINGVWYRPKEDFAYKATGIASYYGGETRGIDFHGRVTANGEIYDMNALTAAHPTLQMPSLVRVTNLENGRSVVLRVNDRGPFVKGRIIDVSRRAAQILGFEQKGTARVRVEILPEESRALKEAMLRRRLAPVAAGPTMDVAAAGGRTR